MQQLRTKIQTEVQDQVQQSQRDYYLREQLKAIQKELGEQDEGQRETDELRQKIEAAGMPEDVKKEAMKELRGCRACLPWPPTTRSPATTSSGLPCCPGPKAPARKIDIGKAKEILDEDHYELKKVKDRILDYLSVLRAEAGHEGADPLLRWPSGRGQNQPGRGRSRVRWAASSSASPSAACTTRRRSAAIAAPISAPCPARSSRASAGRKPTTR